MTDVAANTGFMLIATSLVMLMTPGLAFFYGGLVGRKNVLTIMIQSFVSLGLTTVLWFIFGYSMCFSNNSIGGVIANPFTNLFMNGITPESMTGSIPTYVHFVYQMMFAIITPALITGAFANRVTFKAYLMFLVGWLVFVYFPFTHMIWNPNGILFKWGVLDFAGGIVVHNTAGFAALASILFVGKRKVLDRGPHSIPLVALGTGLLWFGWYGFNAGSQMKVDAITSLAFLNTDVAASFAAISWLVVAWMFEKKPRFVGLLTGAVGGLATITPAAGFVSPMAAAIIGILAGIICYMAVALKNKLGWDDALDVWGVHGVGGMTGIILLGLFAQKAFNSSGTDGLFYGNPGFFGKQLVAVLISSIWAFVFTYAMLWVINKITPVRVQESEENDGLDVGQHGEVAYESI